MPNTRLTIGWACYDDPEGSFWTASSLRLYHLGNYKNREDVQILIIDDFPNKTDGLENLANIVGAKYKHIPKEKGPAHAKNSVFENADGEYVLLLDSHVILQNGAIDYILKGINNNKIKKDMWCGPLLNENKDVMATHMEPKWRGDFYGVWRNENPLPRIFEIPMHGTAMFLMKKEHFPKFSNNFMGFAGEEGYIHEKVRKNGGKVFCHSALGWIHRFMRSKPVTYRLYLEDKIFNYLIAFYETEKNPQAVINFFSKSQPEPVVNTAKNQALAVYPDLLTKYSYMTDVPDIEN